LTNFIESNVPQPASNLNSNRSQIAVEVCVGSTADATVSIAAGADRLELCSGLELGGLTPSISLAETIIESSSVPIVIMVRPRAGGFCYDRYEFATMLRDTERFLNLGAAGVVFGILDRNGSIDLPRVREFVDIVRPHNAVFHRAFDFVANWRKELDALIDIGCTRVLTSGGQPTAASGVATLREMIDFAAGRIEIMPGGGIRADNVVEIVQRTRCVQVHIGAATPTADGSLSQSSSLELRNPGFICGANHRAVDDAVVAATLSALRILSLDS
jgi:copper homeostasis protein